MSQTQVTTTASSIPAIIFTILVAMIVWHWVESGSGIGTGIKMTWQDTKVSVSCRSFDTAFRFYGRRFEDYQADRELFRAPGWKKFVCPIYAAEAQRTEKYRQTVVERALKALDEASMQRLKDWGAATGTTTLAGNSIN